MAERLDIDANTESTDVPKTKDGPQISITFSGGLGEQQLAAMPSAEEIQRAFRVMSAPNTADGNQEMLMSGKLLDARFIESAFDVQRSICRVVTNSGRAQGTGFRISKRLVMTAAHVLAGEQQGCVQFHYYAPRLPNQPGGSVPQVPKSVQLDSNQLYYSNANLDFAVIAIQSDNPGDDFKDVGIITSVVEAHDPITKAHTNVFSHPEGNPMKVSLRENVALEIPRKEIMTSFDKQVFNFEALSIKPEVVIHEADTKSGSSGAPIFNDNWQLIAIHQGAVKQKISQTDKKILVSNYGCIIKYILKDMFSQCGAALTDFELKLRDQADFLGIPFQGTTFTKNFEQNRKKK